MTSILVALTATLIGLSIEFAVLRKRKSQLRRKGHTYRFHELRDRLQLLNLQGKLENTSISYKFLMSSINLAIKNAGTMRLSDVLQISRAVKKEAECITIKQIAEDSRRQSAEAATVLADFFQALTAMLISNDSITSIMFTVTRLLAALLNQAAFGAVVSVGKALAPEQAEAVDEAREYQRWGNVLAPGY